MVRSRYAGDNPFNGEGSFLFGGRWSSAGTRVSYASTHRSLAILEYRAHIDPILMPLDLLIATLVIPDEIAILPTPPLSAQWKRTPAPRSLQAIGDRFVEAGMAACMFVPSVLVPEENNILINPSHRDFQRMTMPNPVPFSYDVRLI